MNQENMQASEKPSRFQINADGLAACGDCGKFTVETTSVELRGIKKLFPKTEFCEACQAKRDEAERQEKERKAHAAMEWRRQNIGLLLQSAGVLPRYQACSLDNFKGKLPASRPAFVCGPPGTGKTHLAVGYLREEIISLGRVNPRLFVRAIDLLREIRETFRDGSHLSETEILGKYGRAIPFLVLDDLGSEKVTDFVLQTLYDILDRRYGECLETLITSNLTLDQLARHYESHGDRLASRIAGMGAVMVLKGKDRRLL